MIGTPKMVSNEYFAGLIDGEGYIGCLLNNNKKQLQPRVSIKWSLYN